MRRSAIVVLLALALLVYGSSARAQATLISGLGGTAGYGTQCLGMNDDGSSNAIDMTPFSRAASGSSTGRTPRST